MWQTWVNLIAGLWVFISGFFPTLVEPINFILSGIVIAVMGFWRYRKWQSDAEGALGLWLIISGLIAQLVNPVNMWIVGAAVTILAIWALGTAPGAVVSRRHAPTS